MTSIRNAKSAAITAIQEGEVKSIISTGALENFQATYAMITENSEGVTIDPEAARNIGLSVGDTIWHVLR